MTEKVPRIQKVLSDLRAKNPADTVPQQARQDRPDPVAGPGLVHHVPTAGGGGNKHTIKMKPLDPPSFDGKAKNYARFKQRFEE